jgi:putative tryptophan/tyrosine transport system substrate-binding protein
LRHSAKRCDAGYVEGRNVQIEYRWADGKYDRLPAMAADLVARPVALIVTGGGEQAAFAAKAATSTIPIVMVVGSDPVKEGLVVSFNRPDGNITGATVFSYEMESKRLGLLHEAAPAAKTIAALFNPANPAVELQLHDVWEAAPRVGVEVITFSANAEGEFEGLFATMAQRQAGALLVGADPFFNSRRAHLIALAAQHRLPAIYEWRQFALDGGLMSYGTVLTDAYSQAGNYASRILNGEKPGTFQWCSPLTSNSLSTSRPRRRSGSKSHLRYPLARTSDRITNHAIILDCCDAHSTSAVGHKPRGRSGPGPVYVRSTSDRVEILCTAAKDAKCQKRNNPTSNQILIAAVQ